MGRNMSQPDAVQELIELLVVKISHVNMSLTNGDTEDAKTHLSDLVQSLDEMYTRRYDN